MNHFKILTGANFISRLIAFSCVFIITISMLVILTPIPASAVNGTEWEYEADEGLHQEEWYDPSDWFNEGGGISYETDWYDYTYGYDYGPGYGTYGYYDIYDYGWYEPYGYYDYGYDYYTDEWYEDDDIF